MDGSFHIGTDLRGRHQRVDGETRVAFKAGVGGSRLADLYQRAPCRVLFPNVEPGEPPQAVVLTTSGGLTGGDRVTVRVEVGPDACVTVATQAAEKLYRALPGKAATSIETRVTVGEGAFVEWLGQEAILFDGARVRRIFEADLHATGRMLAVESLVLGRTAMGERFMSGLIHDAWRIRRGGRLIWVDALRLEGEVADLATRPFGFGPAVAAATVLYVGADAERHLPEARALLETAGATGGATSFDDLLIVRLLDGDAARLRRAIVGVVAGLPAAALGLAPRLPAVWTC
jgi:urease accessory protein